MSREPWRKTFLTDLTDGLCRAYQRQQFTDMEIKVNEKTFYCHRLILCSISPYFEAMFASGMSESKNGEVCLKDVDSRIMETILEFIYTGKDIVSIDNAETLLNVASMLQIKSLQERCELFLLEHVDVENSIGIWRLATAHNLDYLRSKTLPFLLSNFTRLCETEEFLLFDHKELLLLISNNELKTPNEEFVCDAVFRWIERDLEKRKQYVGEIVEYLRLPLVSPEYLMEVLERKPYIKIDMKCSAVIEEAKRFHLLPARQAEFISPRLMYRNHGDYEEVFCCIGGRQNDPSTSNLMTCFSFLQKKWFLLQILIYDPGVEFATCSVGTAIFLSGGSGKLEGMMYYQSMQNSWHECNPMLIGRRAHAMVAVGNCIYLVGGYNDAMPEFLHTLPSIEEYNISMGKWRKVGDLIMPIRSASSAVVGSKILVFGGLSDDNRTVYEVQCFDTRTHTSSYLSSLPVSCGLAGAIVCNREILILCCSGQILTSTDGIEFTKKAEMDTFERYGFGMIQHQGLVYIVGGVDYNQTYNEILYYDREEDTILKYSETLPCPMFGFGCAKTVLHKQFLDYNNRLNSNR